jgi:acyl-coenzyme A thioesterase 13
MANRLGTLHGGATATIFDDLTTGVIAVVAKKDFWLFGGVSRTLAVSYLKPVTVAEVIRVETEIIDIGRRLCK